MNFSEIIQLVVEKLRSWLELAIQLLPNLALAIVVLVIFVIAAKIVRRVITRLLGKYSDNVADRKSVV